MSGQQIRLDVREAERGWEWVLQTTLPVRDEVRSARTFETRAAAIADFEEVAGRLGWRTG